MAGRIFDELDRHFGGGDVFMDIDAIPLGEDFRDYIVGALKQAVVLVVIIGPKWLGVRKRGLYRIQDETDPVRLEVETAFQLGIRVVPVLVEGADIPKPGDLPESLKKLPFLNGAFIDSGRDFRTHLDRLIRFLERSVTNAAPRNADVVPEQPAQLEAAGALEEEERRAATSEAVERQRAAQAAEAAERQRAAEAAEVAERQRAAEVAEAAERQRTADAAEEAAREAVEAAKRHAERSDAETGSTAKLEPGPAGPDLDRRAAELKFQERLLAGTRSVDEIEHSLAPTLAPMPVITRGQGLRFTVVVLVILTIGFVVLSASRLVKL